MAKSKAKRLRMPRSRQPIVGASRVRQSSSKPAVAARSASASTAASGPVGWICMTRAAAGAAARTRSSGNDDASGTIEAMPARAAARTTAHWPSGWK